MQKVTDPNVLAQLNNRPDPQTTQTLNNRSAGATAWEKQSPLDQFGVGLAKPVMRTYYGAKDLLPEWMGGGLSPEEQTELDYLDEVKGPYGTAGEIVSEVGTSLIPAGIGAKAANWGVGKVPLLRRSLLAESTAGRATTALAGETAATSGLEYVKAPEDNKSREDAALENAQWSAAFGAGTLFPQVASAVRSLTKGGKKAEAFKQMDVPVTPGQYWGRTGAGVEQVMANLPFLGARVKRMQNESLEAWNKRLLENLNPLDNRLAPITSAGHGGFTQAGDNFKTAYTGIWNRLSPDNLNSAQISRELAGLHDALPDYLPSDAVKQAEDLLTWTSKRIDDAVSNPKMTSKILEDLDDQLRNLAYNTEVVGLDDIILTARERIRKGYPADLSEQLAKVDKKYRDFVILNRAAKYRRAQDNGGVFSPTDLEQAVSAKHTDKQLASGSGRYQKQAMTAKETLGGVMEDRSKINQLGNITNAAAWVATVLNPKIGVPAMAASPMIGSDLMRRVLTNTELTAGQKATARALRQLGIQGADEMDVMP